MHPPVSDLAVVEKYGTKEEASRQETAVTKMLMGMYGIGNVRGGAFSTIELTGWQVAVLELELRHDRGECLRCGARGHFADECTRVVVAERCFRCGGEGHYQKDCSAATHADGSVLE